jgi:hypothetical protein
MSKRLPTTLLRTLGALEGKVVVSSAQGDGRSRNRGRYHDRPLAQRPTRGPHPRALTWVAAVTGQTTTELVDPQFPAPTRVETIHHLHQAEARYLKQILVRLVPTDVPSCEPAGEGEKAPDQLVARAGVTTVPHAEKQRIRAGELRACLNGNPVLLDVTRRAHQVHRHSRTWVFAIPFKARDPRSSRVHIAKR